MCERNIGVRLGLGAAVRCILTEGHLLALNPRSKGGLGTTGLDATTDIGEHLCLVRHCGFLG